MTDIGGVAWLPRTSDCIFNVQDQDWFPRTQCIAHLSSMLFDLLRLERVVLPMFNISTLGSSVMHPISRRGF